MNYEFLCHTLQPLICAGLSTLSLYLSARLGKAAREISRLSRILDTRPGGRKKTVELWIARDKNGVLFGYQGKPKKLRNGTFVDINPAHSCCVFDKKLFPEVTNENSPKQITILC